MIRVRAAKERGHFNHGWLDTYHTFSFADYYNPDYMSFRSLRVINEDRVTPAQGFPTHSHRDMEIITCILEGALEHKDSMGNTSVIRPGEFQKLSAGTGITHSEFNHSKHEGVHLLQIWILPNQKNLKPEYQQRLFEKAGKQNKLRLVASSQYQDNLIHISQDVLLYDCLLESGKSVSYALQADRGVWIQVAQGEIRVGKTILREGDGASIENESKILFETSSGGQFLLFDLA